MKIINIAYYMIIRNFRDRKSLALTVLFPILLILILGTALSKIYSPGTLERVKVAFVSEDKGALSAEFSAFLNKSEIKELLDVQTTGSYRAGMELVKTKQVEALIYIDKTYTSAAMSGGKAKIQIFEEGTDKVNASILQNLVDSFSNGANTIMARRDMGASGQYVNTDMIKSMPITEKGNVPKAIDYYAVTMLAMILMYGTMYACFGMAEDKDTKTYIRIKSSPTKDYENFIGKTLGIMLTLIIQVVIIIVFTKVAYHVNWGTNIGMVLLLSLIFSAFATALGIFAYAVTSNTARASGILNILAVVLTFISGGYAKIADTGSMLNKVAAYVPNKMFQTAMFNTIYGGSIAETRSCILELIAITAVLFIIASTAGRKVLN